MAKGDVLVRMKADVSNYDANIAKARRTLDGFKQDNLTLGGIMNQTTKSVVAAAAQYASFAAVLGTVAAGFSEAVTKGKQMAMEAEGVQKAFNRLNQPGLLDNLREATHNTVNDLELMKQAVKFDNFGLSLDQMGSMLAFAQQQAKDTGQDVNYLVDSIVTGLGRKSLPILDNLGLSATEIRERMKETGDMTQAVAQIIQERMSAAGGYVETAADRAAQAQTRLDNAMKELGETMNSLSGAGATLWTDLETGAINLANTIMQTLIPVFNSLSEYINGPKSWEDSLPNNVGSNIDDNGNYIRKPSNGNWAGFNANTGRYDNEIQSIPEISISGTKRKKTKSGGGKSFDADKIDFNSAIGKIDTESLKASREDISLWAEMSEEMKRSMLGLADVAEDYGSAMARVGERDVHKEIQANIERDNKALKEQQVRMNLAAEAANNLGAAFASMDDPAAKAAGTVMQAVASIALGFAMASSNANTAGTGWGWLAWLAAGTAAMATTIATVHSLTGYAEGGIVGGNNYSGDSIYAGSGAMVNSGELILNHAQQNTLAGELQGANRQVQVTGKLRGSDIFIAVDRYAQESGKGQLLTFG